MQAVAIHQEDEHLCRLISRIGAQVMPKSGDILTHCNTVGSACFCVFLRMRAILFLIPLQGAHTHVSFRLGFMCVSGCLATGGEGTALGVIACAYKKRAFTVYADETRPLLQGSRLTAWELKELGIPVRVLCDSAAGALLASGCIGAVIVGADRIACNGDVANKIGTYSLAVLARFHNVPFFVAAPFSSFDLTIASGKGIVIEQRQSSEVTSPMGVQAKFLIHFFVASAFNIISLRQLPVALRRSILLSTSHPQVSCTPSSLSAVWCIRSQVHALHYCCLLFALF